MEIIRKVRKIFQLLRNSKYRFLYLSSHGCFDSMPDKEYLSKLFNAKMGYDINWDNPITFNEKMQWLKVYDRKPQYTTMVDKYAVREYLPSLIDSKHIVPLLGVWDNPDLIDITALPDQFVLKTTHGCGGMFICRDKKDFNIAAAKRKLKKGMSKNYYYHVREWPYKDVKPRVIAEPYLQDGEELNLRVYKVFNFGGVPTLIQTIQNDKTKNETIDYFDTDWNLLELHQNYPNSPNPSKKPQSLELILELSRKCSSGHPFLRTDWYEVNGQVLFSEFTFFSDAGMEPFYPAEWDEKLGRLINLPLEKVNTRE